MATVNVVLPVYNEERVLESSVRRLHEFLLTSPLSAWRITIVDNGSTDGTLTIARSLEKQLAYVDLLHVPEAGRGRALSQAWLASQDDVLSYMDIDLSTDLAAFPTLVEAVLKGDADIAAGTRLGPGAKTSRSLKRELLSRGFVLLINLLFRKRLRDTQCGFKAVSRNCAQRLLPLVQDTGWFWDTELLLLAVKGNWNVAFVPVHWEEDTDSRVKILRTVWRDLKGLARMYRFDWRRAQRIGSATGAPGVVAAG